jgi:SpoVK/Ycf46/Vps4 family AAA+-type ATPase
MSINFRLPSELKIVVKTARSDFRGIIALFVGESGTGKTTVAEILAGHLNSDLYRVDLSEVMNKYVGETEKNLKKLFARAECKHWILFFDEADALFGKRTDVRDGNNRCANFETGYLVQLMESFHGIAILTIKSIEKIDKAFLQQIPHVLKFPLPNTE